MSYIILILLVILYLFDFIMFLLNLVVRYGPAPALWHPLQEKGGQNADDKQ